ncbi:MAG TPA: hypothetical protein VJM11_10605 [Nevskiaceae bacterium]|nr:hypothetical protein [Nevskiaceae bacterium]
MAADPRGPFAPAVLAGAILFLPASATAAEFDATMQPIARDAVVPASAKRKTPPGSDANPEPLLLRSADRMAPEYPGDRMDESPPEMLPMDTFVDRTVDVMDSLNSTTNSILRLERP